MLVSNITVGQMAAQLQDTLGGVVDLILPARSLNKGLDYIIITTHEGAYQIEIWPDGDGVNVQTYRAIEQHFTKRQGVEQIVQSVRQEIGLDPAYAPDDLLV